MTLLCGGSTCPEGSVCVDEGICCPLDRACTAICCAPGLICLEQQTCCQPEDTFCNVACCPPGNTCTGDGKCCPNTRACGEICCPDNEVCKDGQCKSRNDCDPSCESPLFCCYGSCCVGYGQQECLSNKGICCAVSHVCNDSCCSDNELCVNNECKSKSSTCDPQCQEGETCCYGSCCAASKVCWNGYCIYQKDQACQEMCVSCTNKCSVLPGYCDACITQCNQELQDGHCGNIAHAPFTRCSGITIGKCPAS